MPGNLDRLRSYLAACRPTLLFTLGTEPAAFLRGMTFAAASKKVDQLLYTAPVRIEGLGITTRVVHLVHPHLFIKKNKKWMTLHCEWAAQQGRALVKETLAPLGSSQLEGQ